MLQGFFKEKKSFFFYNKKGFNFFSFLKKEPSQRDCVVGAKKKEEKNLSLISL